MQVGPLAPQPFGVEPILHGLKKRLDRIEYLNEIKFDTKWESYSIILDKYPSLY